ncbi:MAG: glycosyltransferase [Candidatus Omnitrophica bacterium]|nr:glycosyltransferase [Candidatus Omnitrophota bacterium]
MKPEISVLMANYNKGQYISEAIQSMLSQAFNNWELVICDDGSTDNSFEIIKSFLNDSRIRVLKNKSNLGKIATLEVLIKESKAEILAILDSDDVLRQDALEVMVDAHKNHQECGLIYSQFIFCDQDLKFKRTGFCAGIEKDDLLVLYDVISHFVTFKKKCYLKTEGYDEEILYAEDRDIVFKLQEKAKIFFVNETLYYHRELPDSQSHDFRKVRIGTCCHNLARYKAYKRRLGRNFPISLRLKFSKDFSRAVILLSKMGEYKRSLIFLLKAIEAISFLPRRNINYPNHTRRMNDLFSPKKGT